MEQWCKDLLQQVAGFKDSHGSKVVVKEWLPETLIDVIDVGGQTLMSGPRGARVSNTPNRDKQYIDFDYVYCVGGDGTLLRLLRTMFTRCQPALLPRIISISMGSLNYLSNF